MGRDDGAAEDKDDVEVEYIQEELELDPLDPMYRTFSKIFQVRFYMRPS